MRALLLLVLLWAPHPGRALPPQTGMQPFCTWTLLMEGARYGREVFSVDAAELRRVMRRADHPATALQALRGGQVRFARTMAFLIDVSGSKRKDLLVPLLRKNWPGPNFPESREDVKAFLAWQARTFNQGDEVEYVITPSGAISIRFNRSLVHRFTAKDLTQSVRNMLFSEAPGNPGRLEQLEADLQSLLR